MRHLYIVQVNQQECLSVHTECDILLNVSAGNSAVRSGAKTAEKAVNPAQARAVDLEANDKYARKLEQKLKRVKRDENSILNRGGRWVKNQKERVQKGSNFLCTKREDGADFITTVQK